jgi:hypothetical protein
VVCPLSIFCGFGCSGPRSMSRSVKSGISGLSARIHNCQGRSLRARFVRLSGGRRAGLIQCIAQIVHLATQRVDPLR